MPANLPAEWFAIEQKISSAKTKEEKIELLKKLLGATPKHKATENVRAQIKKRIAQLNEELERKRKSKASKSYSIKKVGDAQICILGFANAGKSTLLAKLTKAKVCISDRTFTTLEPAVGILDYFGVKFQLIEIPATLKNSHLGLLNGCDLVLVLIDSDQEIQFQIDFFKNLLAERSALEKAIFVLNAKQNFENKDLKNIDLKISALKGENLEKLKEKIFEKLKLIKIYCKPIGKEVSKKPVVLKKGTKLISLIETIHKNLLKRFKFARVFDNSNFSGRKVGLNYELKDNDIVEIH